MQKRRGRPGPFYHVNDVSVYLDILYYSRQRWGGVPDRKDAFLACVLRFELRVVRFLLRKRSKTPVLGAETTRSGL